jgi:EAL domain-containing protein (putative c-di-GMP-specific phosphodiesterase class I)
VAVNLSARQFYQQNIALIVEESLKEFGLESQHLELEITESLVMNNLESTIENLNRLKKMGLQLSIDDFGTGYSSLSYLKRFNLDKLKIDKSFVRDLERDPNDAAISASIIALAHKMNLKVIAEGVENAQQAEFLKSQQCDEVQGYFYGRPMSVAQIEQLFYC